MSALELVAAWPVGSAAAGVVRADSTTTTTAGGPDRAYRWASITKVLTAVATWLAVEEGTVGLDTPAGPDGSTVRHLLAHASGLPFEGAVPIAPPGTRRIYSNAGFEVLADVLAAHADMSFDDYLGEGVLAPLGMAGTRLVGSAAAGAEGPLRDLLALAGELLHPRLVSAGTVGLATAVAFADLDGVLPGFGPQRPNDWGLGVEIHGAKNPHWMPATASPRAFGHFGQAGGFVWVDPDAGVAVASLSDRDFGAWAARAWPLFGSAVLAEAGPQE